MFQERMEITVYILWNIWKSRCVWHFEGQRWEAKEVVQKAITEWQEFTSITKPTAAKPSDGGRFSVRDGNCKADWEFKEQGVIIINVASVTSEASRRQGGGWMADKD